MMVNVKIFLILATVLIVIFISKVCGGLTEKFIIHSLEDVTPENSYLTITGISIRDKEYATATGKLFKKIPESTTLQSITTYEGIEMPAFDLLLCDGLKEKIFVNDVLNHTNPKPGFPTQCPIGPAELLEIKDYKFPQYKLPPGLSPGLIIVNVTALYEDEILLKINVVGEIVKELNNGLKFNP